MTVNLPPVVAVEVRRVLAAQFDSLCVSNELDGRRVLGHRVDLPLCVLPEDEHVYFRRLRQIEGVGWGHVDDLTDPVVTLSPDERSAHLVAVLHSQDCNGHA